jgi:hypothetical protein
MAFFNKIVKALKNQPHTSSNEKRNEESSSINQTEMKWGFARIAIHTSPTNVHCVAYDCVQVCQFYQHHIHKYSYTH